MEYAAQQAAGYDNTVQTAKQHIADLMSARIELDNILGRLRECTYRVHNAGDQIHGPAPVGIESAVPPKDGPPPLAELIDMLDAQVGRIESSLCRL